MRRSALLLVVLLAAACAPALAPAPSAVKGLENWSAYVVDVDDGDTFDARLGGSEAAVKVRMTGLQAMELTDYSNSDPQGACMAPEAALRLRELIEGKNVTLSAVDAASAGSRNRPQRYVRAIVDGEAADVGRILLGEGLALWSSNGDEWVKNTEYYLAARRARAEKIGIWDPTYTGGECELGPQQDAVLDMRVQWDADSGDGTNVNGESAQILNRGDEAVDISGWTFRDASLATGGVRNTFAFPAGASIPPGGLIQLKVGSGTDVAGQAYFWGQDKPKFENVDYDRGVGDGGYLFDPDGSLRASFLYPCMPRRACTDPLRGAISVAASFDPPGDDRDGEYIDVTNVSEAAVSLDGYELEVWPFNYVFGSDDVLQPDQVLRVWITDGRDGTANGRLDRYWVPAPGAILNNNGDWARVKTFTDVEVACDAWGGETCGVPPNR